MVDDKISNIYINLKLVNQQSVSWLSQVLPEVAGHMKPDSGAEIAELKKALAKESHKMESLEKDMKQIRIVVEQLQMDPQVAAGNEEESLPGAMASGNVEAKVRILQND